MRRPAPAVALALLVAVPGTGAVASVSRPALAADTCQTAQRVEGPFRSVAKPGELLPGPLVAHAVEPAAPRTVYLADPRGVAVSEDAGCTWERVDIGLLPPRAYITSLTVPDAAEPTGRLLVVVGDGASLNSSGNVGELSTVLARRGPDAPFSRTLVPMPGRVRLAVSPSDPEVVYAGTNDFGATSQAPLRSTDGGATFLPRSGTRTYPDQDPFFNLDLPPRDLAVDPGNRDRLAVGSSVLQGSTDGGTSFTLLHRPATERGHGFSQALAAHPQGGAAEGSLVWVESELSNVPLGPETGGVWRLPRDGEVEELPREGLEGVPQSLAVGREADEIVLTSADIGPGLNDGYEGPGTLFLYDGPAGRWVDVQDRGFPMLDAQVDRSPDPAVHLHSSSLSTPQGVDEYVVYSPPARGRVVPPTVDDGSGGGSQPERDDLPPAPSACRDAGAFDPPGPPESSSRLTPAQATVPLDAAGRGRQDLELHLAGDAVALDLFVVLDTSASLEPAAAGLACGLEEVVRGLATSGVDAHVGLAEFFDHDPGARYRRLVDVAPPGRDLQRALRLIRNGGGEVETHRSALYQSITGEGLVIADETYIEPGQQASFREGSGRMLLHITDEPIREMTGEPTVLAVVDALNGAGAAHVGLQLLHEVGSELWTLGPGPGGQELLRVQLDQLSAATGAVAPAGGVDCDGDGRTDLAEGAPLVCTRQLNGEVVPVAGAVLALADALRPRGPVRLVPQGGSAEIAVVERGYDDVDLREGGRFSFPVALRCPDGARGPEQVRLDAVAGAVTVATSTLTLPCGPAAPATPPAASEPAPGAPPAVAPVAPEGGAPALAAAPPAAPPPVVQLPAPAPASAQAPAPATAPAAAAAGAAAGAAATATVGAGAAAGSTASAAGTAGAPGASTSTGTSAAMAGAPQEAQRRAQGAFVNTSSDVPLAAVPLGGGVLATAALTASLLATRRRRPAPGTVRLEIRS